MVPDREEGADMGLIKAIAGAAGGVLADSWREYFYSDALDNDTLVVKGKKRTSGRSSNTKGEDNIISNGSIIAVNEGQCMMIVQQGEIVDVCAEAGEFVFDKSTEPSIFYGGLGEGILGTFKTIGRRFTFGGDTGKDQRVYFFNTKQIMGNKFGTANPVPFSVYNKNVNAEFSVDIRCNGEYIFRIANPLLFYKELCANVRDEYTRKELEGTLRADMVDALQPALAVISAQGITYNQIPGHARELRDALATELNPVWLDLRGLELVRVTMNPVTLTEESSALVKEYDKAGIYSNANIAAGAMTAGTISAMNTAAGNSAGAMAGFMGMGLTQNLGGAGGAAGLFAAAQQQNAQNQQAAPQAQAAPAADSWTCKCGTVNTGKFCVECGAAKPAPAESWTCKCGTVNKGKFCVECGSAKPADAEGWTCKCGTVNKGKFCVECGTKKPAGAPLYRCDKCGWEPEDPMNPPKFCPNCSDPFNEDDIIQ